MKRNITRFFFNERKEMDKIYCSMLLADKH